MPISVIGAYTVIITGQVNPPYASRETETFIIEAKSHSEAKELAKIRFKELHQRAAGIFAQVQ